MRSFEYFGHPIYIKERGRALDSFKLNALRCNTIMNKKSNYLSERVNEDLKIISFEIAELMAELSYCITLTRSGAPKGVRHLSDFGVLVVVVLINTCGST